MAKNKKKVLHELFVELVKLQQEIISSGIKLLVILEGRDAASKDGAIKRIIKHLSPRETKVVASGKPSDWQERDETHFALIRHFLKQMKYDKKDEKFISHYHELIYPAATEK